jgi:serine/threonine protein phosphatase PrpC
MDIKTACGTDIGGGIENQDKYFVYQNKEKKIYVKCVLDGHGKDVGELAALSAREKLLQYFDENDEKLKTQPYETLVDAFVQTHQYIKESFKRKMEEKGFEVEFDGFLKKRRHINLPWSCIHGGTTCTIIAIIDSKMYIANVGDSNATLCTTVPILDKQMISYLGDAACSLEKKVESSASVDTLDLIMDHSPENVREFHRMRDVRKSDNPVYPAVNFVFDGQKSVFKYKENAIFDVDKEGNVTANKVGGEYYKSVREEWATRITLPMNAEYRESLAMTRSMGDFQMQTFGVSHLPEIQMIDLEPIFNKLDEVSCKHPLCIVLATDGVWDNWKYKDVTEFVMYDNCLEAVETKENGVQQVTDSFMQRNKIYATHNFGKKADNATVILSYISRQET